jgi:hypothetical protein
MWTILKFDKKRLEFLKRDIAEKLGKDFQAYSPKLILEKYNRNKLIKKEYNLLGDYLFCFHKDFKSSDTINKLKFCRGLKYFLNGFMESQNEIEAFVEKCKNMENENGYLSQNFYKLELYKNYKFTTGPFVEKIFKIISFQKKNIDILMGNLKTTIDKQKFLFNPV